MNILIINYEYPPIGAGAANASYFLAKSLAERGHNMSVLTAGLGEKTEFQKEGLVHVYRVGSRRKSAAQSNLGEMASFLLHALYEVDSVLSREKVDKVIAFFTTPCGFISLYLKLRHKIPYLLSLRGGDVPGLVPELKNIHRCITPMRRWALRQASFTIANAKGLAEMAEKADPYPVQIVHNGVDTNLYCANADKEKNDVFKFLFVGRFQNQKNIFTLLEQFAQVNQKKPLKCHLHLVGNGPLKQGLMQRGRELNLEKSLFWHDWMDKKDLLAMYQKSDCLINPSHYEGMPNAVLEGASCALPIIASDVPGNDLLVENESSGYLFNVNHPEELKKAMAKVLNLDRPALKEMGQKSREWVLKRYSWEKVAVAYEGYLEKSL